MKTQSEALKHGVSTDGSFLNISQLFVLMALTVWEVSVSAQPFVGFTNLASFTLSTGTSPVGPLLEASDGNFYGVTCNSGSFNKGTIFKMTRDGTLSAIASFNDGSWARAGLVCGPDGNFYGTTEQGGAQNLGTVFRVTPQGDLTTLVSFAGTNGASPDAALVLGKDGYLYGTTRDGGSSVESCGTVFRLSTQGNLTTLVSLDGATGHPEERLVQGPDGNFYGTTIYAFPSFFRVTPTGELTRLLRFDGTNGSGSSFGLVAAADGNFYGTSYNGARLDASGFSFGCVYRVTPAGEATNLLSFNGANGSMPYGLLYARDGNLYGITGRGGLGFNGSFVSGNGTVFQVAPNGAVTTIMLFTNAAPSNTLIEGTDGCLYGTTGLGGGDYGYGSVFRLTVRMAPVFQSVERLSSEIRFTWSAVSGLQYQVQYRGDSTSNIWTDLGSSITATNGLIGFSDSTTEETGRTYRIKLLP